MKDEIREARPCPEALCMTTPAPSKPLGVKNPDGAAALRLVWGPFLADADWRKVEDLAEFLCVPDAEVRMELEHAGVDSSMITMLSIRLGIEMPRMKQILGIPAGAELPEGGGKGRLRGCPAYAALALVELFGKAIELADERSADSARGLDIARWFGGWIERPLPLLSDLVPASIIALPSGLPALLLVLGATADEVFG
jgi:hypothetical protein